MAFFQEEEKFHLKVPSAAIRDQPRCTFLQTASRLLALRRSSQPKSLLRSGSSTFGFVDKLQNSFVPKAMPRRAFQMAAARLHGGAKTLFRSLTPANSRSTLNLNTNRSFASALTRKPSVDSIKCWSLFMAHGPPCFRRPPTSLTALNRKVSSSNQISAGRVIISIFVPGGISPRSRSHSSE